MRDQIVAGKTTVIVPIGGTEQNGPHMVLGKHNVRVKALAGKIAQALGNALVAPVVAYVPEGSIEPPTAHMRFPGTITRARRSVRAGARIRGAELPRCTAFATSSSSATTATTRRPDAGRGPAQSRMGGVAGARARDRRVLRRDQDLTRMRSRAAATATTRSARTRGSRTLRSHWRSIRRWSGATSLPSARARPGRRRDRRSARAPSADSASRAWTRSSCDDGATAIRAATVARHER